VVICLRAEGVPYVAIISVDTQYQYRTIEFIDRLAIFQLILALEEELAIDLHHSQPGKN